MKRFTIVFLLFSQVFVAKGQDNIRPDSLRGSNHPGRNWYDVTYYHLHIEPEISDKTLKGRVTMSFNVIGQGSWMMIDLQDPLTITEIKHRDQSLDFIDKGNHYIIQKGSDFFDHSDTLTIFYEGKPIEAKNAPWDGGLVWSKDSLNRPVIATACQGNGASIWWPCKDIQSDEPDNGAEITLIVPDPLVAVSNGNLIEKYSLNGKKTLWHWKVVNPINLYSLSLNIAHYSMIETVYEGLNGSLDVTFYVYDYNIHKGQSYINEILMMLECFESKMGPYPFYEDDYKLVETPHLGMEHQSAIAYGNKFKRGYLGDDRSRTGYGLHWDFILIHESGHEWYGNSITASDINDNWIHEGFTTYTESIFTECLDGKDAGAAYVRGQRRLIRNHTPLIGPYGVRNHAPGDIYDKGANLVHTIRTIIDDDYKFYGMLRAMNCYFYHSNIPSSDIEKFISTYTKIDFSKIFDQYLRTKEIPELHFEIQKDNIKAQWYKVVDDFSMPIKLFFTDGTSETINLTSEQTSFPLEGRVFSHWDENIYCRLVKR